MRMLKIFIAYDVNYRIVLAEKQPADSQQTYLCTSCDSALILCNAPNENPCFSHDLSTTSVEQLRGCTYYDPEVKSNERLAKLRHMVQTLPPVVPTKHWHCSWCDGMHTGAKHCKRCHTDIYCQPIQSDA
ncbi:putative zinc ribbon protein [Budvicia aquatica]|uniref:Protein of uncharacterized function (DUF3279) n=1 Tax=Budvicia aquatica TaxID=82979 RepID=A0A2C6DLD7_9GAMM|nr:putative zinc ribbon protein [Budvicia aquatica]PHI29152.1 hypothetical protein CRN84_07370 [Budvicia aquatica]VFS47332.1 Protein of uncharacterised function (DUF3279) [Budvicia aquatica]